MYRDFPIQKEILEKYPESLYLPLWHIKEADHIRLLSYRSDILPRIDWEWVDVSEFTKKLSGTVWKQKKQWTDLQYFLWSGYKGDGVEYEKESIEWGDEYIISQMISEFISNPFIAYEFVRKIIKELEKTFERDVIESDFWYIAHEVSKFVREESLKGEEKVFNELVAEGTLFLAISDEGGYKIPDVYSAPAKYEEDGTTFVPMRWDKKCLHWAVDYVTMNNLEKDIIEELKSKEKVLWWVRNKVEDKSYSIQAWRKNRIYPDFIIAKQDDEGKLELVYIIESKGDHLADNPDTKYKQLVFQRMTEEKMKDWVRKFTGYNFQMVLQSNTKSALKELFK